MIPRLQVTSTPSGEFVGIDRAFVLPEEIDGLIASLRESAKQCRECANIRMVSQRPPWPRPLGIDDADD